MQKGLAQALAFCQDFFTNLTGEGGQGVHVSRGLTSKWSHLCKVRSREPYSLKRDLKLAAKHLLASKSVG